MDRRVNKKEKKEIFYWFIGILAFAILFFGMVDMVSAKPSVTISSVGGLEILTPQFEYLPVNQSHDFYWHLFNGTNLLTNLTATCTFHLYDKQNEGQHIHFVNDVKIFSNGRDYEVDVPATNFTKIGAYCVLIECNTTTQTGGIEKCFEITYNGKELQTSQGILYGSLYFVLILFIIAVLLIMNLLPDENTKSDKGDIVSISLLKYLRGTLWIVEWALLIAVLYLSSNLAFAYMSETLFANIFFVLFRVCFSMTPIIVIIWIIWLIAKIIQDKEMKQLMSRGIFKQSF